MRTLVFAKKINGTDETGLIDVSKNPAELFCLCNEDSANEILTLMDQCRILKEEMPDGINN